MIHLKSTTTKAVKLPIHLEDVSSIKKEAKLIGLRVEEKSGKYEVYHSSKLIGSFSSDGTITDDKSGMVYDLLSSVVNEKQQ